MHQQLCRLLIQKIRRNVSLNDTLKMKHRFQTVQIILSEANSILIRYEQ